jgi:hypothetical protein
MIYAQLNASGQREEIPAGGDAPIYRLRISRYKAP